MRPVLAACVCLLAALAAGACKRGSDAPENLRVPRLLLETRGVDYGAAGGEMVTLPVSGTSIRVRPTPVVDEFKILNVELVKVDLGLALLFQLDAEGSRDLYRASVSNMGGRIVLTVNGNAIGARRIDGAMPDGNFFTFVEIPDEDLAELVLDLKESIAYLRTKEAD